MHTNQRSHFFYSHAQQHRAHASSLLGQQFDSSFSAYYSGGYHVAAFTYPIAHTIRTLVSATRMLQGVFLLGHALFNDPLTAIPQVLGGIANEMITTIFNALNVITSIISMATRTLATIFRFGYVSSHVNTAANSFKGKEYGGRNSETMMNWFSGLAISTLNQMAISTENELYEATLGLSA